MENSTLKFSRPPMTSQRIDGYLSTLAQHKIDPSSLVLVFQGDEEEWVLRRADHDDLGLGDTFQRAQQSVHALIRASKI